MPTDVVLDVHFSRKRGYFYHQLVTELLEITRAVMLPALLITPPCPSVSVLSLPACRRHDVESTTRSSRILSQATSGIEYKKRMDLQLEPLFSFWQFQRISRNSRGQRKGSLVTTRSQQYGTRAAADDHVVCSSHLSTDIPMYESKRVPFDQYMEDQQRLFNALFPDGQRRVRLSDEEWRIQMLPIDFFFLQVRPVVDMRIVVTGPEAGNKERVTKMVKLEVINWDLQGLGYHVNESEFQLDVKGWLYPERRGVGSRLKGEMTLKCSMSVPSSLAMLPHGVVESVGNAVLGQLLQSMKEKVNSRLLQDYSAYTRQHSLLKPQIQSTQTLNPQTLRRKS